MKKTITITMIVILLLNLICIPSYADFDETAPMSTKPQEDGNVTITNQEGKSTSASILGTTYAGGQGFKALAVVLTVAPRAVSACLDLFVNVTGSNAAATNDRFTIYDLVLGHYNIFNIDFTEKLPENDAEIDTFMERVKVDVTKFYAFTRNLSVAISLFVLIYMGIRMAISTVASEQAKYKKMLIDWVASLMILFLMHFITL